VFGSKLPICAANEGPCRPREWSHRARIAKVCDDEARIAEGEAVQPIAAPVHSGRGSICTLRKE